MKEFRISSGENPREINYIIGSKGIASKNFQGLMYAPKDTQIASWHLALDSDRPEKKDHYLLSVIHLRDTQELGSAKKLTSGASHEFLLVPLHETIFSDIEDPSSWTALDPVAITQVGNLNDDMADLLTTMVADGLVNDMLPIPDPKSSDSWGEKISNLFRRHLTELDNS